MLPVSLQGICHPRSPDRLIGVFPFCSEETVLLDVFQSVAVADNNIISLRKCAVPPSLSLTVQFSLKDGVVNNIVYNTALVDGHKQLNEGPGPAFQWLSHLPTCGTL